VIEIILPIGFVAAGLHEAMPLRDAGHHELRGVPGEWQLFEVVSP